MDIIKQAYVHFTTWVIRHHIGRKSLIFLVAGAIFFVIATYVMLTSAPPFLKSKKLLSFLLILDLLFFLSLLAVVAKYLVALWIERKKDQAGSKLHGRMVAIFSLLAIIPTIIVAVFSAIFFNIVIQSWFNHRVETAIGESVAVAGAYLGEHQKVITANAEAMASELSPYVQFLSPESETLSHKLTEEAELRALDEAVVFTIFQGKMQILGRSRFSFSLDFDSIPPLKDLEAAKTTPVIYTNEDNDRVRALVELNPFTHTYLWVGRHVSPTVLKRIEHLETAAREYLRLESQGASIALKFAGIFVGIALLLLLAAVLGGLIFANKLARPIRYLIQASDEVCKGTLSVRISEDVETPELSALTSAFNRMTEQLESQRDDLIIANEQLDERRRFTEAVLAGVSAGVIGLDARGTIYLPNQSASKLLDIDLKRKKGKKLIEVVPELSSLFEELDEMGSDFIEKQVSLQRNGHAHTLLVRLSLNRTRDKTTGYVMTFDDITQLQSAQRKAAWADIARRIAHEIKNPLTPIQLSAERLKRRYTQQILQDPETFQNCVDTIVRQVGHIGQMVSEFSSFARMPSPQIRSENLAQICREEIFLQQQAHPHIKIKFITSHDPLLFQCDRSQMGQVLTNLLQNASQAILGKETQDGFILVSLNSEKGMIILRVEDNGIGLPSEGRERLTEPYITFREKGTGLGLAIVKKIIEDHEGSLTFLDRSKGGTIVQVSFSDGQGISKALG